MSLASVGVFESEASAVPSTERDLVERAKVDRGALGVLFRKYYPVLIDHVYRRTGDVHAAEDLVADVFVIVMCSLGSPTAAARICSLDFQRMCRHAD